MHFCLKSSNACFFFAIIQLCICFTSVPAFLIFMIRVPLSSYANMFSNYVLYFLLHFWRPPLTFLVVYVGDPVASRMLLLKNFHFCSILTWFVFCCISMILSFNAFRYSSLFQFVGLDLFLNFSYPFLLFWSSHLLVCPSLLSKKSKLHLVY